MSAAAAKTWVTEQQAETARQSRIVLGSLGGDIQVQVRTADAQSTAVILPEPAVRLLVQILDGLADRREMRVDPAELSVAEAADLPDVLESFVDGLIGRGELPAGDSASGRLVSTVDVRSLQSSFRRKRVDTPAELQAQAQELGLGY